MGEKILRHFAFLPGELSVAISDGAARITYQEPTREQLDMAKRLAIQGSQKANQRDFRAAADLFTKALAANPAMPDTHRDLAMARYELCSPHHRHGSRGRRRPEPRSPGSR